MKLSPNNQANTTELELESGEQWDYGNCGAADCQDPNVTSQFLSRYTPSDVSMYAITAVFFTCDIIVIIMQYFVMSDCDVNCMETDTPPPANEKFAVDNQAYLPDTKEKAIEIYQIANVPVVSRDRQEQTSPKV